MTRRYSAYKDSGVEWIGEIPEHWEVKKLKYISHYNKNTLSDSTDPEKLVNYIEINDVDSSGKVLNTGIFSFKDAPSRARRILAKDDVLISTVRTYLKAIAFVKEEPDNLICSTGFCVLSPMPFLRPKYLYYSCLNEVFLQNVIANSKGVSYPAITATELVGLNIPFPPLYEQSQIVEFLDAKTSLIDKLIDVKQRRIELLKEKRAALINIAVTKGLDPNVKMKDSGIEWIGEIPEHWRVKKIKYVANICSGDNLPSDSIDDDGLYPVIGGNGIMGYCNQFNYMHAVICVGRVGEKCGNVHLIKEKSWITDNSLVLDLNNANMHLNYIYYQLTSRNLNSLRNQTTQPLITGTMLKNEYLTFPGYAEQKQIVSYLNSETQKIDDLVTLEQKKIDLLKEYRQALISETVTGKIKIGKETGG